jgi:3-oxoacyl-(acyl-carrier-protein) synthase
MAEKAREAWITGVGIVSCVGEGAEAHWLALNAGQAKADDKMFAPYFVHPIAPIEFDKQIPKKGDQRQMEPWQRIGTYAAGLAIESAGLKGNTEMLSHTDMIVAADKLNPQVAARLVPAADRRLRREHLQHGESSESDQHRVKAHKFGPNCQLRE